MNFKTEQEEFWAGEFGNKYITRNESDYLLASNLNFFSMALNHADKINSCIEFGANIGMNLQAIKLLYPDINLRGVEINSNAAEQLAKIIGQKNVFSGSILDYRIEQTYDLVLTKGVLIHLNPKILVDVYRNLYKASQKYILVCEYYNPVPISISYRGHKDRLFKSDFAGELLDMYSDLTLVDYGFSYHRDSSFPQDDISWFLLCKTEEI